MKARLFTRLALVLSFGGIFVSAVLALARIAGKDVPCGGGNGCHTVAADPSSHLLGIDNSFLGLAAYVVFAALAAVRLFRPSTSKLNLSLAYLGSVAGLLYSGYLTYLEIFTIKAICLWCVTSAAIVLVLTLVHAAEFQIGSGEAPEETPIIKSGRVDFGVVVGCFLLAILGIGMAYASFHEKVVPIKAPIQAGTFQQFPLVPDGANIFGPKDAPITIVEFADLQCPTCRAEFPKMKDLVNRYKGHVRLVFRHFPLAGEEHNMALPAAAVAEYAGTKGKFFEFINAMYTVDPESVKTLPGLLNVAKSVGLDPNDVNQQITDVGSPAFARASRDVQAASVYGLIYTPTFFVYSTGNEEHPDVSLASGVEDLLKSKKYRELSGASG